MLAYDETLLERLNEVGFSSIGERTREDGTIGRVPTILDDRGIADELPVLSTKDSSGEVAMGDVIARGGMGVVHQATQRSLSRPVAAKRVKHRQGGTNSHISELIFEGRVMGMLDHPNIAPVYMLGKDDEGEAILVMKRIEGKSWADLLRESGDDVDLEGHIRILMDLCRAVEFAHEQGVLHRDLKPENVMVGAFGEVYLLDWGLAVSIRELEDRGIPLAKDEISITGTPGYMAPEMVTLDPPLGPHTDTFGLGAILHRIVTGTTRFTGDGFQILRDTKRCEPFDYGADVPEELREILQRACHEDMEMRFDAAELRQALSAFLSHEHARQLAGEADDRLQQLESILASDTEGREEDIELFFTEARFGYQQALAIHSESLHAEKGLRRAQIAMARYAIAGKRLEVAYRLLTSITDPPESLLRELDDLERAQSQSLDEVARLKAFADESRAGIGRKERAMILILGGALWAATMLGAPPLGFRPTRVLTVVASIVSLASLLIWVRRYRRGGSNRADLVASLQTAGTTLAVAIALVAGDRANVPVHFMLLVCHLLIAVSLISLILILDSRMQPTIPYFFCSAVPLILWPQHALELSAFLVGGGLLIVGLIMWLLLRETESKPVTLNKT